ncbi:MAG TPA: hypothetical protein ENJ19_04180 [Gammaproteobacteria bacterium]|nr:hypothetical protein [Gammaproteobacteria bacterium]
MTNITDGNGSLLALYLRQRSLLLEELHQIDPAAALTRLRQALRNLERPYAQHDAPPGRQAQYLHHALGLITQTLAALTAVEGRCPASVAPRPYRSAARRRTWFLWGTAVTALGAMAATLLTDKLVIAVLGLALCAMFAAVAASQRDSDESYNPYATAPAALALDLDSLDGTLSRALRQADDLLALTAQSDAAAAGQHPLTRVDPDRLLTLLQDTAAHRAVTEPDKSAGDLAAEAVRLLHQAGLALQDYRPEHAAWFEERPAGVRDIITLLPALTDRDGVLVRKGIVLAPLS